MKPIVQLRRSVHHAQLRRSPKVRSGRLAGILGDLQRQRIRFSVTTRTADEHLEPPQSNESESPLRERSVTTDEMTARKILAKKRAFIIDLDGTIYHGKKLVEGANDFIHWIQSMHGLEYLFLTNSSDKSRSEIASKLGELGLHIDADRHIYTSAMAAANYLSRQIPMTYGKERWRVWVLGHEALKGELERLNVEVVDKTVKDPDYVVVGETTEFTFDDLKHATELVLSGARLIGTNCDVADRVDGTLVPSCGSIMASIEAATDRKAFYVGKPNGLMMSYARRWMSTRRSQTIVIGDRMNTDILSGIEAEIETCLVLTGVTQPSEIDLFAYRPSVILPDVGSIPKLLADEQKAKVQRYREAQDSNFRVEGRPNEKIYAD